MKLIFYRNSILASVISIFGCGLITVGVVTLMSGEIFGGIIIALTGFGLAVIARKISESKESKDYIKQLKQNGVEDMMRQNLNVCLEVYKQNRFDDKIKNYIISVNPMAVRVIDEYEANLNNRTNQNR